MVFPFSCKLARKIAALTPDMIERCYRALVDRLPRLYADHRSPGNPYPVAVTMAHVTDRQGALEALKRHASSLDRVHKCPVDGGYTGKPFAKAIEERLVATQETRRQLVEFAGSMARNAARRG
ncbi:MAG: hypothetical protein Kow0060_20790 [Methylohalobius crimeensis]